MKKIIFLSFLLISSCLSFGQSSCDIIGEISIESVQRGAFLVCSRSANPTACSIALAADACGKDPACSGIVKTLVKNGCTWTVKVVGDKMRIIGKASSDKIYEMKRTYNALNSVQGIYWLQNTLSGR